MQRAYSRGGWLDASVPLEDVTGETVDISEYLDFGFYARIWFHDNAGLGEKQLGRWLVVSKHIGSTMTFYVLAKNGQIISRSSVQRATNLESQQTELVQLFKEFDEAIKQRLKDDVIPVDGDKTSPEHWADLIDYDQEYIDEFDQVINSKDVPEADEMFTSEIVDDTYLKMEIALPRNEPGREFARVTKRLRDTEGCPIGTAHSNPILDTRMYEIEYSDGHKASMAANAIALNMFVQVEEEGNRHVLFHEITDYRTSGKEIKQQDAFIVNNNGTKRRKGDYHWVGAPCILEGW